MILEIGTLAATAIGYVIGGIKSSKGLKQATDEISVGFWEWIKPIFLKEDKDMIEELETEPDNKDLQIELQNKIKRFVNKDPEFAKQLEDWIKKTPIGSKLIAEKLYAKKDIKIKANQENSEAKFNDLKSDEGSIDIEIIQK